MAIFNFKNRFTSGFDQNALTTTTDSEHVFNFGRLTTTGDLADAIFAGADNVTIRNFARIETSGLGAAGILAIGNDARIENYGTVATRGGFYDPDLNVDGDEAFSEGLVAGGSESRRRDHARCQGNITGSYADLASAPSIMSTVFASPYTATKEPKRGPFSWPRST
jgi:hypothetical protein